MAVTSGFFNAVSQGGVADRKYTAEQMSSLFDGIITEGVFQSIGSRFSIALSETPRVIKVGSGRAWLHSCWIYNDSTYEITIPNAPTSISQKRIDTIALEIDKSTGLRRGAIVVVQGTAAETPVKPTLENTSTKKQMAICHVTSIGGTSAISGSNIQYVVGTSECPFIAAPTIGYNLDSYFSAWQSAYQEWLDGIQSQYDAWWDTFTDILTEDQATNLANRLLALESRVTPINLGGTGANNKITAKTNLGIVIGDRSPDSMASFLDTNDIYIYIQNS